MYDLIEISKKYPSMNITISADELTGFAKFIIEESRKEEEKDRKEDRLVPRKEAAEKLDVDFSSLWRWAKSGYLLPVHVGGKVMYLESDINKIIMKG